MKIGDFVVDIYATNDWGVVLQLGSHNIRVLWRNGDIDWTPKRWVGLVTWGELNENR